MKNRFLPFAAILAVAVLLVGFYTQDPTSSRSPVNQTDIQNPVVPQTNAIVKYVDSLNGANDSISLKNRGYKIRRGALMGPPGTNNGWFQGNDAVFPAFNGPTTGYVAANYNTVSGTNTIDLWLISPVINASSGDTISFYSNAPDAGFVDSIRVHWASNGDTMASTGSWTELGKFKVTNGWTERRFVIPAGAPAGRFAINYRVANGGPSGANSDFIGVDFIRVLGPAAPLNTTLLLVHDSTQATTLARRKQDRDSMRTHLGGIVGGYDLVTFDSSSTLPNLSQYNKIIIQETAFDAILTRFLGLTARNNLVAWLNTGTVGSPKRLYMLGGDLAYNYSRATSPAQDLNFSGTIAGYIYRLDNAFASPGNIVGITIDAGNTRPITTPGANYYPDGVSFSNGSYALYRYGNHTAVDTLAGVVRGTGTYEVRSLFCDPSYFSGGFQPVLSAFLNGTLTGINQVGNIVPEVYSLSQNYPNPFNPVTNIKFSIPQGGVVKLVIFDILGREVATLVNEVKPAGNYVADFDASALSSGAYFYRLESGNFTETKKMLLVK